MGIFFMKQGLSGSAVNELEVFEREAEFRHRAFENLARMKKIESVAVLTGTRTKGTEVWKFYKIERNGRGTKRK